MKKTLPSLLALVCIVVASQMMSCTKTTTTVSYEPVRTNEPGAHSPYARFRYRPNQIVVMFKSAPSAADLTARKVATGIDTTKITIKKCLSCDSLIQLWEGPNIESTIQAAGIRSGSSTPTDGHGEDGLAYYSLNFVLDIPTDSLPNYADFNYTNVKKLKNEKGNKEVVRIAVLDTGIDTIKTIGTSYLWTNQREASTAEPGGDEDENCYFDDRFGWNFIENNDNVLDNNKGHHGTLVSLYIINQFKKSTTKTVELMVLKTHDENGSGDLFKNICAIHYAKEKGAQIINASWGFYYYHKNAHPYLDFLITKVLRDKGILFVTAAGNKMDKMDDFARDAYEDSHPGVTIPYSYLRNLEYHNFYPACLSKKDNNVVTVTTANNKRVSKTQNYSEIFVDLGAIPDDPGGMRFRVPFDPTTTISGSSFATAIATGRIGAFLHNSSYQSNIDKSIILADMEAAGLITKSDLLEPDHIRLGRITSQD